MRNIILDLDKKTIDLILIFERISILISLVGIIGLYIHLKYYIDSILYLISVNLFRTGLLAGICSFCFGVFFNGVKKGLIH